jgi:DNA modification methylase
MPSEELRPVERIPIKDLTAWARNARTHSQAQRRQIAKSIRRFGFTNPVLIDDENRIIAGHGRVAAAKDIGIELVPCIRLSEMSDAEKRAYVIADNALALKGGWDMEILATELQEIGALDIDVSLTGFDQIEIDAILTDAREADPGASDGGDVAPEAPVDAIPVTETGDLWRLGRHMLLCGDAKDTAALALLMGELKADMIFTDPPFNLPIEGHVSGLGRVHHREFAEGSGEMSEEEFERFLRDSLGAAASVCRDGAIAYVCMDWRHLQELIAAGHLVFSELKNICVWNKGHGGMGTFYRSQHEMVLVWKVGTAPHTNNFGLGDKGRYRTNVWTYAGANSFRADRMDELASHPTVKPLPLVADAIRDVSHRGEVVLDVFGGSGTTLIAAQKTGRVARLIEIDPIYCDVTIQRWEKMTGKVATLVATGEDFDAVRSARSESSQSALEGWPQ